MVEAAGCTLKLCQERHGQERSVAAATRSGAFDRCATASKRFELFQNQNQNKKSKMKNDYLTNIFDKKVCGDLKEKNASGAATSIVVRQT
jgi:hypothetical protein